MTITHIHSYLVNAERGLEMQSPVEGTEVPNTGQMFNMLRKIFVESPTECKNDIVFLPNNEGEQQNDCRDLFVQYIRNATLNNGRRIAARLQEMTTNRSGLGLLFLIIDQSGHDKRMVISHFAAENGGNLGSEQHVGADLRQLVFGP